VQLRCVVESFLQGLVDNRKVSRSSMGGTVGPGPQIYNSMSAGSQHDQCERDRDSCLDEADADTDEIESEAV